MNGKDTAKKVVGFLLFRSAFTQRNITAIALVIFLFVVYRLSGGGIGAFPKLSPDAASFGGVQRSTNQAKSPTKNIFSPSLSSSTVVGKKEESREDNKKDKIADKKDLQSDNDSEGTTNDPLEELRLRLEKKRKAEK